MSNEIATIQNNVNALEIEFNDIVDEYKEGLYISFKKEAMFAIQAMQANNYLMSTATRNPESMRNAVLNVASIGISLNPAEKNAYLVPRGGKVCLDVSYMGLVSIATSQGSIDFCKAELVRENDTFSFNGIDKAPDHQFNPFGDRGKIVGVYCVVKTNRGDYITDTMNIEEVYAIRDRTEAWKAFSSGKTKSCPWSTDPGEMIKKTVIKRAAKTWPKVDLTRNRLAQAIEVVNEHEGIDFKVEQAVKKVEAQEREDYAKKGEAIEGIRDSLALLTAGFEPAEKGQFMVDHVQVNSFKDLQRKSTAECEELNEKLIEMVEQNRLDAIENQEEN